LNPLQKNIALWLIISLVLVLLYHMFSQPKGGQETLIYSRFIAQVESGNVSEVTVQGDNITGSTRTARRPSRRSRRRTDLIPRLQAKGIQIAAKPVEDSPWYMTILISWFPMILLIGVWIFFMRQMQSGGGKAMAFGKSRARLVTDKTKKVTFADVAGIDEAKEELTEVISFLKDPKKFTRLGGRIPKGLLLVGSPGTGKTLLARAIAGEADVPFLSISGSDFVEMFVGVGASRVRDLFEQGRSTPPASSSSTRSCRRPSSRCGLGGGARRAGADAQPAPGRDGRLRVQRRGHPGLRNEPARCAGSGSAPAGAV
jgi:cell division protease FtsH